MDFIESLKDKPDGKLILVTALSRRPPARVRPRPRSVWGCAQQDRQKASYACASRAWSGVRHEGRSGGRRLCSGCSMRTSTCTSPATSAPSRSRQPARGAHRQPHLSRQRAGPGRPSHQLEARVDMNDRALRNITVGLGGPGNGYRGRTASTSWSPRRSWRSSAWRPASRI